MINAGNPYHACILVMQDGVPEDMPLCFEVSTFDGQVNTEQISLFEVCTILVQAWGDDEGVSSEVVGVHDGVVDGPLVASVPE
jgi:hypothetical protein